MRIWLLIFAVALAGCSGGNGGADVRLVWSVTAADFDDDGYNDLAVSRTQTGEFPQPTWVEVLLQDSANPGNFLPGVVYNIDTTVPRRTNRDLITAGDIDLDGAPDLVTTLEGGSQIAVLLNLGDGTFEPPLPLASAAAPVNAAIADLNNDSKPDILVGDTQLSWFPQDPTQPGQLLDRQTLNPELGLPARNSFVVTTDFDTDSRTDIVTAENTLRALLQLTPPADPPFAVNSYPLPDRAFAAAAADFDGNGTPDVAVVGGDWLRVYAGDAGTPGALQSPEQYTACECGFDPDLEDYDCNETVAVADLNQDTALDIVLAGNTGALTDVRTCLIVFPQTGVGTGAFSPGYRWNGPKTRASPLKNVAAADLNGDGLTDLALAGDRGLRLFLQDPANAGSFLAPRLLLEDGYDAY